MSQKLLLFTLTTCGHCKDLKEKLRNESIPFTEIEVNQNQKLWNQVVEQTKNEFLPTFYIKTEGSDTGPIFCPDKDFKDNDEAIEIIKKYITKEEGGN
jgi:glutaredoxin